jgi:hypothetical protein
MLRLTAITRSPAVVSTAGCVGIADGVQLRDRVQRGVHRADRPAPGRRLPIRHGSRRLPGGRPARPGVPAQDQWPRAPGQDPGHRCRRQAGRPAAAPRWSGSVPPAGAGPVLPRAVSCGAPAGAGQRTGGGRRNHVRSGSSDTTNALASSRSSRIRSESGRPVSRSAPASDSVTPEPERRGRQNNDCDSASHRRCGHSARRPTRRTLR